MEKIKEVSNKYGTYNVGEMVGVHALDGMYWRNYVGVLSEVVYDNAIISSSCKGLFHILLTVSHANLYPKASGNLYAH